MLQLFLQCTHLFTDKSPHRCEKFAKQVQQTSSAVTKCIPIGFVQRKGRIQEHLREILSHLKHSVCLHRSIQCEVTQFLRKQRILIPVLKHDQFPLRHLGDTTDLKASYFISAFHRMIFDYLQMFIRHLPTASSTNASFRDSFQGNSISPWCFISPPSTIPSQIQDIVRRQKTLFLPHVTAEIKLKSVV
jgi:hypothetical protein